MTWREGEIVEFAGRDPRKRDLRKIRERAGQDFDDMAFFHVELARRAGYPDEALAGGRHIAFTVDPLADRPKVAAFKPYEGPTRATPRPTSSQHRPQLRPPDFPSDRPARRPESRSPATHFLNPYHFLPLAPPAEADLVEYQTLVEGGLLHERFEAASPDAPEAVFSGRLLCRLETEGPVVVGAEQRSHGEGSETEVSPFELPDPEDPATARPAVPGSTLRGLISSLVEAATSSALRVLGQPDRPYTRRAVIGPEALSAVGLIRRRDDSSLGLLPLTRSVHEMGRACPKPGDPAPPPGFPLDRCRALLNGFEYDSDTGKVWPRAGTFLASRRESASASGHEHWYADLSTARLHWRKRKESWFCIGLDLATDPMRETEWKASPELAHWTRGLLLVLGLEDGKAAELPPTKKHEYFLPFPPARENEKLLDLPDDVLEEFRVLARDAAELPRGVSGGQFPLLHTGRQRPQGDDWTPRDGDLVYFDGDPKTGPVTRIAYSALWRRFVKGTLRQAIGGDSGVSPDLLPFDSARSRLTPAERLFGVVEADGSRALAGRVRFSHALAVGPEPADGWYDPPVTLKILNSPKPPSPALYFGQDRPLAKHDLDLRQHVPQGRKIYLHHRTEDVAARSYETSLPQDNARRRMQLRVRPLRHRPRGTAFLFHVDFWNLSRAELGALLYAIRPTEAFRHKLGLGKPLGLGKVRIDPLLLAWTDRNAAYGADGLFGPRYAEAEVLAPVATWGAPTPALARRTRHERIAAETAGASAARRWPSWDDLHAGARSRVPERVRVAIEKLGDPAQVDLPVTYPVRIDQDGEGEHYLWFVANERARHGERVRLGAVEAGQPLPALPRLPPPQGHG